MTAVRCISCLLLLAAFLDGQTGRDASASYSEGAAQFTRHEFAAAKSSFERAISLDPGYADAYKGLGMTELELKNYNAAYRAWLMAGKLNPSDAKTKYYLGRLFYEADLPNEAAAWLRESLKLAPNDYASMTYLGLSAEALGYEDTALQLYEAAVAESKSQNKPYSWAFLSLGKLRQKRGDNSGALAVLEEGERRCPEAHELAALGELLASSNQQQRAEEVLRRAIDLDPSLAQAHYRLALLMTASGRSEDARLEMDRFQQAKDQEKQVPRLTVVRK